MERSVPVKLNTLSLVAERAKEGTKQRERERERAVVKLQQLGNKACVVGFTGVYWERRAARVTSANNTEPQSQEVCEASISLHPPSSFFCFFFGLKLFKMRQNIVFTEASGLDF